MQPLFPNQSVNISLPTTPGANVMKMDPLTMIQIALKNNVDVFYFASNVPMNIFFSEDGTMGRCGLFCVSNIIYPLHILSISMNLSVIAFFKRGIH